jgi:hypothetical protein
MRRLGEWVSTPRFTAAMLAVALFMPNENDLPMTLNADCLVAFSL